MKALLDGFRALGPVKLGAMALVTAVVLGFMTMIGINAGDAPMALLYGDVGLQESASMVQALTADHIPYSLHDDGHTILVPATDVAKARLLLATKNLPHNGNVGYSLFDKVNPLTGSSFLDRIDETRALDGELAQTIELIQGVRSARVQIVLSSQTPFAQDAQPAQASVLLSLNDAVPLDRQSIDAILNLVASAVPGLKPEHISIVDDHGELLAQPGQNDIGGMANRNEDLRRATELRLEHAVEDMLSQTLGPGHVRAVASVKMDFDQTDETSTTYDPNGQVPRSQQQVDQKSSTTQPIAGVSVQNNLPNATPQTSQNINTSSKSDQTTNYEISQVVKHVVATTPQIARITLAVMVDGTDQPGPGGKPEWQPRTPAQLTAIRDLVKTAIGYDKARGDVVEIQSLPFIADGRTRTTPKVTRMAQLLAQADIGSVLRTLIMALTGLIALLFVFRPLMSKLTSLTPVSGTQAELSGDFEPSGLLSSAEPAMPSTRALAGPAGATNEAMVNLTQIDGQIRMSSLRQIGELADLHPAETVAIIRGWLGEGAGR